MGWIGVVLNDSSGKGDCAPKARQLQKIFAEAGREARVAVARGGPQLRSEAERALHDGCELLVAGGGDGTLNTVA
jgi:diacylglycerol kinase family enzyme